MHDNIFKMIMKRNNFSMLITFFIINAIGMFLVLDNPIIGSLILIFSGFITFTFPKIIHLTDTGSSLETSIINIRIGSSITFLCGFIFFVFSVFMPSIFFGYIYKGDLHCILEFCIWIGTFLMAIGPEPIWKVGKGPGPFIHNKTESFVFVFIIISLLCTALYVYVMMGDVSYNLLLYITFFIGFLLVICPNSIDTTRTKSTRLYVRLCGIMSILGAIITYIPINFNNIPIIVEIILYAIGLIMIFFGLLLFNAY